MQGYDRYAYANNDPVKYVDPSGHNACGGLSGYRCQIRMRKMEESWLTEEGDNGEDSTLETYTLAGIETASPSLFGIEINYRPSWVVAVARFLGNDHVSEGRAKLYPEEIEKLGIDPQTSEGAFLGMQARISSRMEACAGCSDTDLFIVAALGSDYNFSVGNVETATADRFASDSGPATINWADYLKKEAGRSYDKYMDLIKIFTSNVQELQSQGYYMPSTVDFDYIQNLLP